MIGRAKFRSNWRIYVEHHILIKFIKKITIKSQINAILLNFKRLCLAIKRNTNKYYKIILAGTIIDNNKYYRIICDHLGYDKTSSMKVLRKALHIIIVENERIIRVPLADELREAGYRVQEFMDSSRALNAVERMPVDVVITDIKMPQMDGLELLSRVKSVKPDTPVIVMTAYGSEDMAIEAMERGAYDYIEKPFDLDEMLALLARIEERIFIDRYHT